MNPSAVGDATKKTIYHDKMYGSTVRYQNGKSGAKTQAEQISCEYKTLNIQCISQVDRHFSEYILSAYPFPPPGVESTVAGKPRHKMQVGSRLKW